MINLNFRPAANYLLQDLAAAPWKMQFVVQMVSIAVLVELNVTLLT